jgi:positive regulator of sigma E activity
MPEKLLSVLKEYLGFPEWFSYILLILWIVLQYMKLRDFRRTYKLNRREYNKTFKRRKKNVRNTRKNNKRGSKR